jgi:general stress protein YciG
MVLPGSGKREKKMAEEKKTLGKEEKGKMTVQEAGKKGGMKTAQTHGREFYEEIGHKGGQKVKELIEEGKKARSLSQDK